MEVDVQDISDKFNNSDRLEKIISDLSVLPSLGGTRKEYLNFQQNDLPQIISMLDDIQSSETDYVPARILKSALLIKDGKHEESQESINIGLAFPSDDANMHYRWGTLCDILDLNEQARNEYSLALRIDSNHKESAYSLGLLYFREGDLEKAIKYLQRTLEIDSEFAEAYYLLGTALESRGLSGVAKKAFARAKELNSSFELPNIFPNKPEPEPTKPHSNDDLTLFIRLFSGREGVHARQWMSPDGKAGYAPVSQPLLEKYVESHLAGNDTLGIYLVRTDNTVKVGVIDIDITKSALTNAGKNENEIARLHGLVEQDCANLMQIFKSLNIPSYMEYSGWKGRHFWLFFDKPIRAAIVKNFLKEICNKAGSPPQGLNREIFPKQDAVSDDGLGSLVKLPLGIHKFTGRRCLFLDESGKPYEDQLLFLRQIKLTSEENLRSIITNLKPQPKQELEDKVVDDSSIKLLMQKCNVIKFLSDKAKESGHLTHDERVVVLYILGHLGEIGRRYLHIVIGQCSDYDYQFTEKQIMGLRTYPISCPRIRERLPDITSSVVCDCQFPEIEGSYPTPVRHVEDSLVPKVIDSQRQKPEMTPTLNIKETSLPTTTKGKIQKDRPTIDDVLTQYIELRKSIQELDTRLKQKEDELAVLFEATGKEKVQTSLGELTREIKDRRNIWKISI
jgi:Tfp pilus assembly protein PilF